MRIIESNGLLTCWRTLSLVEPLSRQHPRNLVQLQLSAVIELQTFLPNLKVNTMTYICGCLLTSVATDRSSAPVVFGHKRAIRSNRMSLSTLMLDVSNFMSTTHELYNSVSAPSGMNS